MGGHDLRAWSSCDIACILCLICGGFLLGVLAICSFITGFIMFVIAGWVAFSSPFEILPVMALMIGVIGIVLTVIIISLFGYSHFCSWRDSSCFRVVFLIFQFLFGIVALISFPVGIILAVGFFSLEPSLDVVIFAKPFEKMESAADLIVQTQKKMRLANILLIIGFVFMIFPIICFLMYSLSPFDDLPKEKRSDALVIAIVQVLCGLLLFLPLHLLGSAGLAPFGIAVLRDSTYIGLYVLGIIVGALGAVNIVVVGVSLILPTLAMSRILGVGGCVASVVILVYASFVLVERTKAGSNLQAFCTADAGVSAPTRCETLLMRFQTTMCVGGEDGEGEEEVREGEREEEEDEESGEKERCEDRYTMEILQEKMLASTRGWMGFMGFACMFLAFVYIGLSLLASLGYVSEESFCGKRKREEREEESEERGRKERRKEKKESVCVGITLGATYLRTDYVESYGRETVVYDKTLTFTNVEDNEEAKFELRKHGGDVLGTGSVRLSEYPTNSNTSAPMHRIPVALEDDDGMNAGLLEIGVEIDRAQQTPQQPNGKMFVFLVDKFTRN